MKKLLAILGSMSMVASLTTLVVACGGNSTTTKQDLTSLGVLPLGVFEDTPDDQAILDAFNVKSLLNLNLVLTTDVTITDKTINGATIISNPDSILCTGSTTVTFTIKKDLNDYEKQEFTIDKKEPDVNDILTMFNNANDISLVLGIDVTIKINIDDKKATITALPTSEKVKGEVNITFDSRIFLGNINLEPFKYLNDQPNEDKILKLINEANGLDLKWNVDLSHEWINKNGTKIYAIKTSIKVTGDKNIEFKYKPKLEEDYHLEIKNKFPKNPSHQQILDEFNELNSLQDDRKLILKTDVTIEDIEDDNIENNKNKVKIKAVETSKKVQGKAEISFELKTDISTYRKEISKKWEAIPNDDKIIDEFNQENIDKPKLIWKQDVIVTEKSTDFAIIKALDESPNYTGSNKVIFTLKKNIFGLIKQTDFKNITDIQNSTLYERIRAYNHNIDNDNIWNAIQKNIDPKIWKNNFTKTTFQMTMIDNDIYFGTVIFTFTIKIPPEANENDTVYVDDDSGKVVISPKAINFETDITRILRIGYDGKDYPTKAHKMPKKVKYIPKTISYNINIFDNLFKGCIDFNDPDISDWSANWISMSGMFEGARSFNQNLSNWYAINVYNMSRMFMSASSFNNAGQKLTWNIEKSTNMQWMFREACEFNQDISYWDVSNVKDMRGMFWDAYSFNNNGKPLNWEQKTRNVTDMENMFLGTKSFNQDVSSWDVSSVTDMYIMFYEATAFNNGDKPLKWGNKTSNVTNMSSMFKSAKAFNQDVSDWNVSKVDSWRDFAKDANSSFTPDKWPPKFRNPQI